MAAVGISDVFRYGTRFLAHVLVVVLAGFALVLTGNLVGEFLVGTISSPGIRAPPETLGWVGVVLALAGVLVTVGGLGGLLFKLVADGTAAGTRSVLASEGALDGVEGDGSQSDDSEDAGTAPASESTSTTTTVPGENTGESGSSSAREGDESPPTQAAEEPKSAEQQPPKPGQADLAPQATEGGEPAGPPPQQPPAGQRSESTPQSNQHVESPSDEPATQPAETPPSEPRSEAQGTGENGTPADEQPEWTPPDPEEFEQHQSTQDMGADPDPEPATQRDEPVAGDEGSGFQDETKVVDEGQFDNAAERATSWDDLQESAGNEPTAPVDEPRNDAPIDDPFATDDRTETGQGDQAPDDQQADDAYDDEFVEDQPDENVSYSFETEGDDDPLSDALGDE